MNPLIPAPWDFDPPANLRIEDIRTVGGLAPYADAWADLLLQSPAASPMLSYPQISAFFETQVPASQTWLCLLAFEDGKLIALLPLIAVRSFGALGLSILCLKTPYDILHTSGVDCLTVHGRENLIELFMDYLSRIPCAWPLIRLRELPGHSPSMVYLNRPGAKFHAVQNICGYENYIEIPATVEQFHAGLSSNFRRQVKRGGRKLEELKDVRFRCREATRSTAENMRRFEEVEDAGWKGAGNSSIKAVEGNSKFYAIAAERFQKHGWMEWNFLETGDQTIGAHYAVRMNRTVFLLKIAYDEAYSACSPGNQLLEKAIEHACQAGDVAEINCVSDCAWHKNWGMKKRTLHDLVILPDLPVISALVSTLLNSKTFHQLKERRDKKSLPAIA